MAEMGTLGKYEIRARARPRRDGRRVRRLRSHDQARVALKTIRADQLAGENAETVVARFRREAQAAGRL